MDKRANRQKWIAALRSGEFKQSRGALNIDDGFCCLGVACEVYRRETGNGEWFSARQPLEFSNYAFRVNGEARSAVLPWVVKDWLGLNSTNGSYSELNFLYEDNDYNSHTFEDIANTIESEPKGLIEGLEKFV